MNALDEPLDTPPTRRILPPHWRPFMREADLARMCLAAGLNALARANHMNTGLYNQAFFNTSIGLERMMKLIYLIDHALSNDGDLPTQAIMRNDLKHDLVKLWGKVEAIRDRLADEGQAFKYSLPDAEATRRIIGVLAEFARSTRYYNLDYLVGSKSIGSDPVKSWATEVGRYLVGSYPERLRKRDEDYAEVAEALVGDSASVLQESEDGTALLTVTDAILHGRRGEWIQKEATFHSATIVRELLQVLWPLNDRARRGSVIELPNLFEYFIVFNNPDSYLKGRRTFIG